MSFVDQFKNGKMTKSELQALAEQHPDQRDEIMTFLSCELSESDLNGIAAAGVTYNRMDGTQNDDTMTGTAGRDAMYGLGGDDDMDGGAGNDKLFGGDGDDNLKGGSGNDLLMGGKGDDNLDGGSGGDVIAGGSGDDNIDGGSGNDYIEGGSGDDDIQGGRGSDVILGGAGDDYIDGGRGNDELMGGSGDDAIDGGRGNDIIMGGTGDDTLTGGQGQDAFIYRAGDGDDVITDYTPGEDKIGLVGQAGDGSYDIHYDEESGNTTISFAGGTLTIEGAELDPDDLYFVNAGSDQADFMGGGEGHDVLLGGGGDDFLYGGDNSDALSGGQGNDYLDGGFADNANDIASGGAGDDVYVWSPSGDGSDTFNGGEGNDQLILDMNADSVQAGMDSGQIDVALTGADGNPVEITADMFDANGNLIIPEGVSGTVTGADGDVMTFTNVEFIGPFGATPPFIDGVPAPE